MFNIVRDKSSIVDCISARKQTELGLWRYLTGTDKTVALDPNPVT